jgi:hypothetical protein
VLVTLAGGLAIGEELQRPHRLEPALAELWRTTPPGGRAYLVVDMVIDRLAHLGTPHHAGFVLVERRRSSGALPTEVLVYRRATAP